VTSRKKNDKKKEGAEQSAASSRQANAREEAGREAVEKTRDSEKGKEDEGDRASVTVVGIGTSAGGLKAMEGFFDHLPSESGMAFVVIQHLAPNKESYLGSLLKSHTSLPIHTARDGMEIEPDTVYLKPPRSEVILQDGALRLRDVIDDKRVRHPIDEFFSSLAREKGENSVAVVSHDFPGIGRRVLLLNARRIEMVEGPNLILLAFEDAGNSGLEADT
jgi:two-component system CheB/CheR fusion protein